PRSTKPTAARESSPLGGEILVVVRARAGFHDTAISCILATGRTVGTGIMPDFANTDHLDDPDRALERHAVTIRVVAETDDNILMRTRRLSRTVTEIYDAKLRPFGVSAVQFSLLEMIGQMQPATRADIARKQELDKSTLTRDLKSIFSDGLVEEVWEGANGRSRPIALTKAGKQLLLDAEAARHAAQIEATALLRQHGFAMENFIARANIDRFLSVLNSSDLTETNRSMTTKLLFAEDRTARSQVQVTRLRSLRDGLADGSTERAKADKLLVTFETTHQLMVQFRERMRRKADGRGIW